MPAIQPSRNIFNILLYRRSTVHSRKAIARKAIARKAIARKAIARKAIVFSLDSIIALLAAFTIIVAVMFYMNQASKAPFNTLSLNRLSQDSLAILEKDSSLRTVVESGNASLLEDFLSALPSRVCAKIDIFNASQAAIISKTKSGCPLYTEVVVERRIFIANENNNRNVYYAEMYAWHNQTLPGGMI